MARTVVRWGLANDFCPVANLVVTGGFSQTILSGKATARFDTLYQYLYARRHEQRRVFHVDSLPSSVEELDKILLRVRTVGETLVPKWWSRRVVDDYTLAKFLSRLI
ncbi:hypothetical protein Q8F57_002655 [Paraburkholderia terrae]|uniref:hypothetical protein n=1 Tax=Paraburkholderia terrae TaxID=311230 RepID=UPI00296AD73B|nr:hypothetical protein [Paraburkholderia terrae]MDW3662608.1 hypothetical protein [Paraburkholderia terrae]